MLSTPCALTVGASLATAAPTVDTTFLVNQRRQKWGGPLLRHAETGRRWMGKAVKALVEVCQLAIADRRLDKQPHRNYKYIQLTSNTDCNSNVGCVIAHTEVKGTSTSPRSPSVPKRGQALTQRNQARASAGRSV